MPNSTTLIDAPQGIRKGGLTNESPTQPISVAIKAIHTWSQQRGAIIQVETSYTDLRGVALMTHTRLTLDKSVGVLSP